jgi:hypothetical protein
LVQIQAVRNLGEGNKNSMRTAVQTSAVQRRSKLAEESRPRSVEKAVTGLSSLSNIAEPIRHGLITVGVIRSMGCEAIANDAHQSLAMLVRRKGESLPRFLERLDRAVGKALTMISARTKSTTLPLHRDPTLRTGRVHLQMCGHDLPQSQASPTCVYTARRRRLHFCRILLLQSPHLLKRPNLPMRPFQKVWVRCTSDFMCRT